MSSHSTCSPANTIAHYYRRLAQPGLSKYVQLQQSIIHALEDGKLHYEDKLPPERELGDILSISLGTTQKALSSLATEGYVVRKHGVGTFVGHPRKSIQRSWHYRFTDPATGEHLPVFAHFLKRGIVGDGAWTQALGHDPAGYIRIDRRISIDDRFNCYSEFYLGASNFRAMLDLPQERLQDNNLKEVLDTEFGYPTTEAKGAARLVQLDSRLAKHMQLPAGSWALRIAILGKTQGQPISYQKMYVPSTDCELDMDFSGSF